LKHKYKALFTGYVKNLHISDVDKNFILDSDFIDDNPDFYLFYPLLFSEYFEVEEEIVSLLCVAGYFYYQSTIFLDKVIDEKQLELLFSSMVCQEEAVKILSSLFPLNSKFWSVWNKRKTDYKKAILLEQKITNNPNYEKYCELAVLKATFGNCAIDSIYHLSEDSKKTTSIYEVLLKTHDYFSVAYQLNDDILDFVDDYKNKQFNWAIHNFEQSYFKKYSIEDCKKLFYLDGYASKIFKLAIKELDKALLILKENQLSQSLWFNHIVEMKLKFENSINEIENYLFQIEVETEKSNILQENNNIEKSILKGTEYIKKSLIKNQRLLNKTINTSAGAPRELKNIVKYSNLTKEIESKTRQIKILDDQIAKGTIQNAETARKNLIEEKENFIQARDQLIKSEKTIL